MAVSTHVSRFTHLRVAALCTAALSFSACHDLPTIGTPDHGPAYDTYVLEPVVADGSGCSNPEWTRDDHGVCEPPPHNGGGGSDPGDTGGDDSDPWGGGGGDGSGSDYSLPSSEDDYVESQEMPDCTDSGTWTEDWHRPYCTGSAPTGSTLTAFDAALSAMEAKGGICAELAQYGRDLLTGGRVRYYTSSGDQLKAWGGPSLGIIMDTRFLGRTPPYTHPWALAHELEHAYTGYTHTVADQDTNGVSHTPNDTLCGS